MAITYIYSTTAMSLHDLLIGTMFFKGLYIDVMFVITAFLFILKLYKEELVDRLPQVAATAFKKIYNRSRQIDHKEIILI